MAFARRRVLCSKPLEGLNPGKRRLALMDRAINPDKVGMGCSAPGAIDGLRRSPGTLLLQQQLCMVGSRRSEVFGKRLGFARQRRCPSLVAVGEGCATQLVQDHTSVMAHLLSW